MAANEIDVMDQEADDFSLEIETVNVDADENIEKAEEKSTINTKTEKLVRIPLTRVKHLMKLDPDVTLASQEAVFLIARATELFVDSLAKEAFSFTSQAKKKTLQKKDIDSCIEVVDALYFLEGKK
ncbi:DNA polymerase epsilon subunit 4-like [Limulus polyphemus]|uniref:DNA polymerase epsilon subunit 4-like n=1 Tax=Limulus polyphemus TaxID=6850 RepID=A0ABM1BXI5_LIMPO|nr:DNA polymerase epsilon subunit 4-like [Limulus polyphemus]